jgi:arylformamidase
MTQDSQPLWRGMDRARLDIEYNARATTPHVGEILAEYRARTDRAKAALRHHAGIAYGPTEPERVDIYPAGPGAPVFVFVHGGYWRALDAADSGSMAPGLVAAGICVVVVNYALAPAASLTEITRQVRAAVAWVHGHIAAYGGDPRRLHVGGSSAGGHLAGMLAAIGWQADFGLPEDAIASATMLSGLFELAPLALCHIDDWMRFTPAEIAALSPARLPLPHPRTRLLYSVAETETAEFKRQTQDEAARTGGRLVPAPAGSNHFDIVFALDDPSTALGAALLEVLRA